MESMSMTQRVLRRNRSLPASRYCPYTIGSVKETNIPKEKQREEVVKLGVKLSLFVAEAMFILSDDIRSMSIFCCWLFKHPENKSLNAPVVGRMFLAIEYVFETYIKPKNGIYKGGGKSIQWENFNPSCLHFAFVVRVLDRIVTILRNGGVVRSSGFVHCNQELKKLEEKLRSLKDVSEANGFAREAIESNIIHSWKSLFETTHEVLNTKTRFIALFKSAVDEINQYVCCRGLASLLI
ncbi:hypothetical protein EUTSA_v10001856mg [Eutrema salsugineum]|uniref:Uncharacterized protein n=1 Tax=Eutrema salsugineum TaxID=72664 RepID=V4LGH8_EUTSA|nr:hypothetical protein EUTSA_v10001856mg [Eutrema salsugineum]